MEINVVLVFALFAIFIGFFKYKKRRKKYPNEDWDDSIKTCIALAAIGGGVAYFIAISILPSVTIIDSCFNYKTKYYLSKAIIKNDNPERSVIEAPSYTFDNLIWGCSYIANISFETLVLYPVVYGDKTNVKDSVTLIAPSSISRVKHLPNYYFNEPEQIRVSENIFLSIFHSVFGSSEVRWVIDSESNIRKRMEPY